MKYLQVLLLLIKTSEYLGKLGKHFALFIDISVQNN